MADSLDMPDIGTTLTNVPFGELIKSAALAIAEAQSEMDKSALRVAEMMSGSAILRDPDTMVPIDVNGQKPVRSEAGIYYTSQDGSQKFEPAIMDTRVAFGRELNGAPIQMSMLELGFTPTFYQFVETVIEVKIALTMSGDLNNVVKNQGTVTQESRSSSVGMYWGRQGAGFSASSQVKTKATPIDATYTTRYNYAIEASSFFRTKLVPVPPPSILEQRIRQQMATDLERERLNTLPVAAVELDPKPAEQATSTTPPRPTPQPLGPTGEQLWNRPIAWSIVGTTPTNLAGISVANGVVTRQSASTTGTVTIKATSGLVESTIAVELA